MNTFELKDYLESKIVKKEKKHVINQKYDKLKIFFHSITSVLLDKDLSIILLNERSNIIGVYSNDGKDYDYLCNHEFKFNISKLQDNYYIENVNGEELSIFYSPISGEELENIEYILR